MVEIKNTPWDIVDTPRFKFRGVLIGKVKSDHASCIHTSVG